MVLRIFLPLLLSVCLIGCGNDSGTPLVGTQSTVVTLGALGYNRADGAFVAVSVSQADVPVTDATVTVNGQVLTFGPTLPLGGQNQNAVPLPIYLGAVTGVPGGPAAITVQRGQDVLFQATTQIPEQVNLLTPAAGAILPADRDLVLNWSDATPATTYYADYSSLDSDNYLGTVTRQLTATIPGRALVPGAARLSVTALSDSLGVPDGTTLTAQDDPAVQDATDSTLNSSAWMAFSEAQNEVDITPAADRQLKRGSDRLTVAQTTYITKNGVRLKQNVYNPIHTEAAGNINFHLRFERWTVAVGGVAVIDGATNQTVFEWSKARIGEPKRKKYEFSIPARPGYVLVILERQVDTIWGPDFVY